MTGFIFFRGRRGDRRHDPWDSWYRMFRIMNLRVVCDVGVENLSIFTFYSWVDFFFHLMGPQK